VAQKTSSYSFVQFSLLFFLPLLSAVFILVNYDYSAMLVEDTLAVFIPDIICLGGGKSLKTYNPPKRLANCMQSLTGKFFPSFM